MQLGDAAPAGDAPRSNYHARVGPPAAAGGDGPDAALQQTAFPAGETVARATVRWRIGPRPPAT